MTHAAPGDPRRRLDLRCRVRHAVPKHPRQGRSGSRAVSGALDPSLSPAKGGAQAMGAPGARDVHAPGCAARACPDGRLDTPRPCPLPRPWAPRRRSLLAPHGRLRGGAPGRPERVGPGRGVAVPAGGAADPSAQRPGGLRAPPSPALPPGGAGCRGEPSAQQRRPGP